MTLPNGSFASQLRHRAGEIGFVLLYVALDHASFIDSFRHLNITPWNPPPALGLLFLIRRGYRASWLLLVALILADLLVRSPEQWPAMLGLNAVLTIGYTAMAAGLKRIAGGNRLFETRNELLAWCSAIAVGSLANSLLYIGANAFSGALAWDASPDAVLRFWIGDTVGILVTFPFLWWLQDASRRKVFFAAVAHGETIGYAVLTVACLFVAFGPIAAPGYRLFYILFLPIVWAAMRQGIPGAVLSIVLMQVGMVMAGQAQTPGEIGLLEIQIRLFLLALVGLFIGVTVSEQMQAATRLRESLRLAAAGEMAAAVAHELNQPLTALTAYGSACRHLAEAGDLTQLKESLAKMDAEANRAAAVVMRLRDLFKSGVTRLEPVRLHQLVEAAVSRLRRSETARHVDLAVDITPPDLVIEADRIQMEIALGNLLANSLEAMMDASSVSRRIAVTARIERDMAILRVEDSGPGIPAMIADSLFEPYFSTKSSGLGLGLSISRAIVEAHGGRLSHVQEMGGCFEIQLPLPANHE